MTDVLSPMLIPYARFLEVRARRRQCVTQPAQPDAERPTNVMVASEDLEGHALAAMVVNTDEEQTAVIQVVDMKPVSS
jgi:hypothetical protein